MKYLYFFSLKDHQDYEAAVSLSQGVLEAVHSKKRTNSGKP